MATAYRDFNQVRNYIATLAGVVAVVGMSLLVLGYGLNLRIERIETARSEYHLASARLCLQIRRELRTFESNLRILEVVDTGTDDALSADYTEIVSLHRENATVLELLRDYLVDMDTLQRRFQGSAFSILVDRLVAVDDDLVLAMDPQFGHQDYHDSTLLDLFAVSHQLGLLHTEGEQIQAARTRDVRSQNFLIFVAIAVAMGFAGLVILVRSLSGIKTIFEDNVTTHDLLRQSESLVRGILDTTADGIVTIDSKGIIQSFNETAGTIFGYTPEEMIGKSVNLLMPEPYTSHHDGYIERFLDTGEKHIIGLRREVDGLRKDGTTFPLDLGVTEMSVDGEPMFNGVVRDLSDRKRAEEETFKLQKALAESSNEMYIFDSETLKFSYVNPGALKNLGYSEAEIYEMDPLDLKPEYTEEQFRELIRPLLDWSRDEIHFETAHKRKDGSLYPVEIRLSLTRWEDKAFFLAVILDVTERKKEEAERQRLEEQMQHAQKLESLGVLAGGIAHDFNNLLMSILGNADLAQQELSPVSPAIQSIKEIETASVRAAELCRQMLAYSGKGKFVVEVVNINEVVEEMTHLMEVSISKQAILKYNMAHNIPLIEADTTQLRQIIMNLITNASDAIGDKSGVISISTGAMDCDQEYLDSTFLNEELTEGTYAYIEVADTGCGMDMETQQRLFDPFFTTKFTGRGLGLAAALGIVRGHGGAVKVYSELGKGTTFKVLFPVAENAQLISEKDDRAGERGWLGEGTILLVDDEETVVSVGKRLLEASGFSVLTAVNGLEALAIYKEHANEIACVLLDLTMPHMDGEETFRELRRLNSDVRVILSSGYNEQEITGRFVGKGLAAFIQKPYRLAVLKQTIREVLGDPSA